MAMIHQGPTIRSSTTGLSNHAPSGHMAFTVTLIGAKELANVMAQVPKSVASAALRVSVMRGVNVVQEEIQQHALNLGRYSFGVYSRSLINRVDMGGRFTCTGTVGNLKSYREHVAADVEAGRSPWRRPAKYWHWVEWGSFNVRTGRRNRGHHLLHRSVMKALPKLKRTLEAAAIETLARHFRAPPLMVSQAIMAGHQFPSES